jgi:hypothetical protein
MANPLRSSDGEQSGRSELEVGETRPIIVRDKDGSVSRTLKLKRTTRPYVEDLVTAYNEAEGGRKDLIWIVGADGNPHLEFAQAPKQLTEEMESRNEAERQKWMHRHNHPERYV